jgi:hypothetical protein
MLAVGLLSPVRAHEAFANYIWHRVELKADARHFDVTVELTFFEEWSARERVRMDLDGDGRIGRTELVNYTRQLADSVKTQLDVLIAGRRLALVPLYDPEVDLLTRDEVGRWHHQLTLRFFATLPKVLAGEAEVVVEDRLWLEAPRLGELKVASDAREQLKADPVSDRAPMPSGSGVAAPLRFTARYAPRSTERPDAFKP